MKGSRTSKTLPCHIGTSGPSTSCFNSKHSIRSIDLGFKESEENIEETLHFRDGIRSIDYVLVWDSEQGSNILDLELKRKIFETNLLAEGLELEYETIEGGLNFIKIHASLEFLRKYCEILKFRMPMREEICRIRRKRIYEPPHKVVPIFSKASYFISNLLRKYRSFLHDHIKVDENIFPEHSQMLTAVYSRDKEYLFDVSSPNFFNRFVRSHCVEFILDHALYVTDDYEQLQFGIKKLVSIGVYSDAYVLHDGNLETYGCLRYALLNEWASLRKCLHYQPIDYIKDYFGAEIGMYFAWLGFYTYMLGFASVVGIICFTYNLSNMQYDQRSEEICNEKLNITMCPMCDGICNFWKLSVTCVQSKIRHLIINPTTIIFSIFMSFWAAIFTEYWKRYSAEITYRWNLTGWGVDEENPRPRESSNYRRDILDVEGRIRRKYFPKQETKWKGSEKVILALSSVIGVILYRMSALAALNMYQQDDVISTYSIILCTGTGAVINLILIFIFNLVYSYLAEYLTELEVLRTQTEFNNSLTLKIYVLQFVNYYASLFYIAFCKGKLAGNPKKYNRILGYRLEQCRPGGCITELCIQLVIIMAGKQTFTSIGEMGRPLFKKWWRSFQFKRRCKSCGKSQWEQDYQLIEWKSYDLFPEYLEMVLQYGFTTIFVAAFPLTPLFALINNMFELRLDAKKLLILHRRTVSRRAKNIGVWLKIIDFIGKASVLTNALIIAFTSDLIPTLVYKYSLSPDYSLTGYLNFSLSFMDISDLDFPTPTPPTVLNYCRYEGFRRPPWAKRAYTKSHTYWVILAYSLAFIVIFENLVVMLVLMVHWLIPDTSSKLRDKIRRETYFTNKIIIAEETKHAIINLTEKQKSLVEQMKKTVKKKDDDDDGSVSRSHKLVKDVTSSQKFVDISHW
ncbi:anoctamin-1-like isoform X3 [Lycorma delicatula]|uniref:anoctamin-1-like isoform X3 n=1 Tax=Lycorma delicatula TaxID=130591 RepID=UPI003F50F411